MWKFWRLWSHERSLQGVLLKNVAPMQSSSSRSVDSRRSRAVFGGQNELDGRANGDWLRPNLVGLKLYPLACMTGRRVGVGRDSASRGRPLRDVYQKYFCDGLRFRDGFLGLLEVSLLTRSAISGFWRDRCRNVVGGVERMLSDVSLLLQVSSLRQWSRNSSCSG